MRKPVCYLLLCLGAFLAALVLVWVNGPRLVHASYADRGWRALPLSFLRYLMLFSPVLAAIGVGFFAARAIGGLDELQQRIQLESFAFSLANTVLVALALGLLTRFESLNVAWVLPIAAFFYGIGFWMARRRYR